MSGMEWWSITVAAIAIVAAVLIGRFLMKAKKGEAQRKNDVSVQPSVSPSGEKVSIELEPDEALVLFEMLSRYMDEPGSFEEKAPLRVQHLGEVIALSRLLGRLEVTLVEPFLPDYVERVESARERLRREFWGDEGHPETP